MLKANMKRFSALLLSAIFILSIQTTAFGAYAEQDRFNSGNENYISEINSAEIINQLSNLDISREVSFIMLSEDSLNDVRTSSSDAQGFEAKELLQFDSVEEFEQFLIAFIAELEEMARIYQNYYMGIDDFALLYQYDFNSISSFSSGWRIHTESWWAPLPNKFNLATWRNIDFRHNWANGRTTSVTIVGSNISGFQLGVSWIHRFGHATVHHLSSGSIVSLEVTGNWLVGASIFGVPVGAQIPDTWTRGGINRHNFDLGW